MNIDKTAKLVHKHCSDLIGKDLDSFTALPLIAMEREKNEELRAFIQSLGTFLEPNEMLGFHENVGTATDVKNGISLRFAVTRGRTPAVTSNETGKVFLLSREGIARLAVRCGINEKTA